MSRAWLVLALLWTAAPLAAGTGAAGLAVDGHDAARVLPPPGARVAAYEGAGYRLTVRGGEARVEVDASPLSSAAAFTPPERAAGDAVTRLARAQVIGAATRYEAVSRILSWVARHVEYRLDRGAPQTAAAVLARRSGYCTGIARLTVALLEAVGIEAREVAGYVADDGSGGVNGYHRWIEAYLPDRGWVMSDPLTSHHYVPATYVRLASGELHLDEGLEGVLLERDDRVAIVDVVPGAGPGVTVRRNGPRRLAAALGVRVEGAAAGPAVLVGPATFYRHALVDGGVTFVGLEPGSYELRLQLPGGGVLQQPVELPDRVWAGLRLRLGPTPQATTMRR